MKTREEMNELFADVPEALSNTLELLDKVEYYSIDHAPVSYTHLFIPTPAMLWLIFLPIKSFSINIPHIFLSFQ